MLKVEGVSPMDRVSTGCVISNYSAHLDMLTMYQELLKTCAIEVHIDVITMFYGE